MATDTFQTINLDGDEAVISSEIAPATRGRKRSATAGTKIQTQVPQEWRAKVASLAREKGVRESDILREFVAKCLGVA